MRKSKLLIERGHSVASGSEYPSDATVVAHDCLHERAADAFATVRFGNYDHRYIAIGHSVGECSHEPYDLATLHSNKSALRARQQLAEFLGVRYPPIPAASSQKSPCGFHLGWSNHPDLHLTLNGYRAGTSDSAIWVASCSAGIDRTDSTPLIAAIASITLCATGLSTSTIVYAISPRDLLSML